MSRAALLAVLGLLAAGASAPAAAACGDARSAKAQGDGKHRGRAPLIVGDSTLLLAVGPFGAAGIEANARGCRQYGEGLQLLRGRRRAGTLPAVVIVALGANGPVSRGQIAATLRVLGPRRILVLVTPRNSGTTRAAMRRAHRAHPSRVLVADWASYSRSRGRAGWFAGDGLHVSHTGARAYTRYVRRAVAPLAFPPVRALRLPRRSRDAAKACGRVRAAGRRVGVFVLRGRRLATCRRARAIARRPPLRRLDGWRAYDWRRTGHGPWTWVYARTDRRVVIGTVAGRTT